MMIAQGPVQNRDRLPHRCIAARPSADLSWPDRVSRQTRQGVYQKDPSMARCRADDRSDGGVALQFGRELR